MKKKYSQQPTFLISLLLAIAMSSTSAAYAQPANYTKKYDNPTNTSFLYTDNVVLLPFVPSTVYNIYGTVLFKSVEDANSLNDLIIHLLDETGTIIVK